MSKFLFRNILFLTVGVFMQSDLAVASGGYKNSSNNALPSGDKIMELENNSTKDDDEWQVVKEPYFSEPSKEWLEIDVLKRKDGFSIVDIGSNREFRETFLVRGDFGEFKFHANRWAYNTDQSMYPTNIYIVDTDWYFGITENDSKLCKKYSKDIESALLHYPVRSVFHNNTLVNIPIKKVLFNIGKLTEPHHYVNAGDL